MRLIPAVVAVVIILEGKKKFREVRPFFLGVGF